MLYFLVDKVRFPMFSEGGKMNDLEEMLKNVADGSAPAEKAVLADNAAAAQREEDESDEDAMLGASTPVQENELYSLGVGLEYSK